MCRIFFLRKKNPQVAARRSIAHCEVCAQGPQELMMLQDSCWIWRWSSVLEEGGTYELHSAIQTFEKKKKSLLLNIKA